MLVQYICFVNFFELNTKLTAIFVMYIRQRLSHKRHSKEIYSQPMEFRLSQRCSTVSFIVGSGAIST
jgi:hypothetical protein